ARGSTRDTRLPVAANRHARQVATEGNDVGAPRRPRDRDCPVPAGKGRDKCSPDGGQGCVERKRYLIDAIGKRKGNRHGATGRRGEREGSNLVGDRYGFDAERLPLGKLGSSADLPTNG